MSSIKLKGDTSGSVTLAAPATGSDVTLTLPATAGTVATTAYVDTAGGLQRITSQSFSSVSAVNVNNCFTTGYDAYRVVVWLTALSTAQEIFMKWRNAGSDLSASSYLSNNLGLSDGGTSATRAFAGGSSGMSLGYTSGSHTFASTIDVFDPAVTERPIILGITQGQLVSAGGFASWRIGGKYNAAATADGMSIITSTGTMTGTLRIYGYKD